MLECESGWEKKSIGSRESCFKPIGTFQAEFAMAKCREYNAKLPRPNSQQENVDFWNYVKSIWGRTVWEEDTFPRIPAYLSGYTSKGHTSWGEFTSLDRAKQVSLIKIETLNK